ncbi:CMGC protein kinase [Aspergillus mulundensis]|uniref:non-specific serine/threonine protein kinase n=1 Tax=Aspergillus mulundensis TaxID=1810919 RepID=A0A3D8SUJ6_9EURO|nr:CMGC protein kinase [Aspergillus mulundensis]RDW89992.1 CMGC protein kinase [Aspergillus mulundensis]
MSFLRAAFTRILSGVSKRYTAPPAPASLGRVTPPQPHRQPVLEELDHYGPGGFHRVRLGDTFHDGQYTILRKLGYGQYSTVWLARDSIRQKYIALKVLRADCYGGKHDIFEKEILERISEVSKQRHHQGAKHVSHLLDDFMHSGPNGEHVCLVFDVLGHHLGFQTIQFLGLDFLHRDCGIIHTDLKPTNILLELDDPSAIPKYLSEVPARTDSQSDDVPRPLREVLPTSLVSETKHLHVRLIDFGVGSWRERHLSEFIQSQALRAPEVTIGVPWDTGVDIWSLGCLVIELVQGIILFSGQASTKGTWTADDDRLARIIEVFGPFPPHFLEKGQHTGQFFDDKGNLLRIPYLKPTTLERLVNGKTMPFLKPIDMPDAEVPIYIDFLKGMLEIDPEKRKSAAELLEHEWIRSVELSATKTD